MGMGFGGPIGMGYGGGEEDEVGDEMDPDDPDAYAEEEEEDGDYDLSDAEGAPVGLSEKLPQIPRKPLIFRRRLHARGILRGGNAHEFYSAHLGAPWTRIDARIASCSSQKPRRN